jgi:hypothetical protein
VYLTARFAISSGVHKIPRSSKRNENSLASGCPKVVYLNFIHPERNILLTAAHDRKILISFHFYPFFMKERWHLRGFLFANFS